MSSAMCVIVAPRMEMRESGLDGSSSSGCNRRRISLLAQFSKETFGRDVGVTLKQFEQGIVDLIRNQWLGTDWFSVIHAFRFDHQLGVRPIVILKSYR